MFSFVSTSRKSASLSYIFGFIRFDSFCMVVMIIFESGSFSCFCKILADELELAAVHVVGGAAAVHLQWVGQGGGDEGALVLVEVGCVAAEVFEGYCFCSVDAASHFYGVEVDFHDALLGPEDFDEYGEVGFECLAGPCG